jgi:hypothetical protein
MIFCPFAAANPQDIAKLEQNGFFATATKRKCNTYMSVRKILTNQLKYSNKHDLKDLSGLYADSYVNGDGLNRSIFLDLVKKTWKSYPDIKYYAIIRGIDVNGNKAIAHVDEYALATSSDSQNLSFRDKGLLESNSSTVYYLENINGLWQITSDHIDSERTYLRYGEAKFINIDLDAPNQISAGTPYTAALNIEAPKNSLIIASIGNEKITYPQENAPEVFRKLDEAGTLERIFTSNNNSINEYAVSSFGITRAKMQDGNKLKVSITGLGFAMTRVNVIPKNNFIKAIDDDKTKTK